MVYSNNNAEKRTYEKFFLPPILSLPMTPVPAVSWLAVKKKVA
jgi:hypothetical protein